MKPARLQRLALLLGLLLLFPGCASGTGPGEPARFRIRESATSQVFRVEISAASAVAAAEELRQSQQARWVLGTPRSGDGGFNPPWHWSLDPATISFAEITIEACQSTAAMVDADLAYWIQFGQLCLHGVVEAREG